MLEAEPWRGVPAGNRLRLVPQPRDAASREDRRRSPAPAAAAARGGLGASEAAAPRHEALSIRPKGEGTARAILMGWAMGRNGPPHLEQQQPVRGLLAC